MIVASVKQVLSGDTIVVLGQKGATLRLSLTGLKSPRFPQQSKANAAAASTTTTPSAVVDELFGYESREFLRRLVIGKKVVFRIDHKHPSNADQVYGTVWVVATTQEAGPVAESVNALVAREGWARLKDVDFKACKENSPLALLEQELRSSSLQAESKGVNQNPSLAVKLLWDIPGDFDTFAEQLKKQGTTKALIEYCRDGSTFKMLLTDSRVMIWFSLAGVMSARKPVDKEAPVVQQQQEDPLSAEAKRFTEIRLLQREVVLEVGGFDTTNRTFYGVVKHPNGNISEELIKNGLGKVVDWSVSMLPNPRDDAPKLRTLQREAQEQRKGAWKDFVSVKADGTALGKEFEGVVAEIVSGDTIVVRIGSSPEQLREQPWTCEERRISLSSLSAPRLGPKTQDGSSSTDENYAVEAKEFLRSKFAGQKVRVRIDYSRQGKAAMEGATPPPTRYFATVTTVQNNKLNLAMEILKQGLAEVVQHRTDDDRSLHYDDMLQCQQEAKQAKRGMFSPAEPPKTRRMQLQNDAPKAKNFLPHLQREKDAKHKCVVEWCGNGSRFGVDLPDQNCVISFALAGVVCPSTARRNVKDSVDEPFSREALAFSRAICLHQPGLKLRVETMDRAGTFLGTMFVGSKEESSLACMLLERGLAKVQPFSAEQTKYKQQLYDCEKRAKLARLGVWKDWSPEQDQPAQEELAEDEEGELKYINCTVVDVVDGNTVYLCWKTAKTTEDKRKVEEDMDKVLKGSGTAPVGTVKRGQMVCAAFNDGTGERFYRARVEHVTQGKARVKFIDYGNEDLVALDKLRTQSPATAAIPALAQEKKLAFVTVRTLVEEYGKDAAVRLSDLVFNGALRACDTRFGVVLAFVETEEEEAAVASTINRHLIAAGLGFVNNKDARRVKQPALKLVVEDLQEAEDHAHRRHLNLWQFGDPRQDDDE